MTVKYVPNAFNRLSKEALSRWKGVGTAEASDCLNRSMALPGAIGPIAPGMLLLGQARTVDCMVADNSALHAALALAEAGDVLVVSAQGFENVAVWGGLMTRAALDRGIAGLVVDGAVRDVEEIAALGFSCFARCAVPRGPHKNFGGTVDFPIACAGVRVCPGDLVIGDADGVTIVPKDRIEEIYTGILKLREKEKQAMQKINDGGSLAEIYGVPDIVAVKNPQ